MKYIEEFRSPAAVQSLLSELKSKISRPWSIMEICGGQTHEFMKSGIDQLLPEGLELIHGPGCPVCVTAIETIDKALAIAALPQVIFTSYGDMLRVPGTKQDLFGVRAAGGNVRIVYSPLDAVKIAQENPEKQVVFLAIGFETTAPANAMSVLHAKALGLKNFSVLSAHVCVPPAMRAILSSPQRRVQGFLAAGHVCAVMGYWEYPPLAEEFKAPIVVTGFEPVDLLKGVIRVVEQLEDGRSQVENAYERTVTLEGNRPAQAVIKKVFRPCDRKWRGIGVIPDSGWCLREELAAFDAERRFAVHAIQSQESPLCIAGEVLQGLKKPLDCPAFGNPCTPQNPLGAPMVSAEGACAAYFMYRKEQP